MNRVIATILLTLAVVPAKAVAPGESPKLVVGITVDQLRSDYLYALQHLFGEKGFKKMLGSGTVYDRVRFDLPYMDRAVATATIYTGTIPFTTAFLPRPYMMPHRAKAYRYSSMPNTWATPPTRPTRQERCAPLR